MNLYQVVNSLGKSYQPRLVMKSERGDLIANQIKILYLWKTYFDTPNSKVGYFENCTGEHWIPEPSDVNWWKSQ